MILTYEERYESVRAAIRAAVAAGRRTLGEGVLRDFGARGGNQAIMRLRDRILASGEEPIPEGVVIQSAVRSVVAVARCPRPVNGDEGPCAGDIERYHRAWRAVRRRVG
jgi:hypothetical protein